MNHRETTDTVPFSSNAVRLTLIEWCALLVIVASVAVMIGEAWKRLERFEPSNDFRVPYESSEDYWLVERYCRTTSHHDRTFVLGDSFVWGQYVTKEEGLPHFLNRQAGSERFANVGLDGTHPLALEGLVRHYCRSLRNREVVLHLNLMWLSSPQADLQTGNGARLNHPRLVPQFISKPAGHNAPVSERLGIVLARHVPVLDWSRHLRITYFSSTDLNRWTLENPYRNPLGQVTFELPEPTGTPHPDATPWFAAGARPQNPPWVGLDTSLQWQAFERLVNLLEERGNRVFVLVGPLNEHMLAPVSRTTYRRILHAVETWLKDRKLPYYIPPVLPSELYADLSHPLGQGYARLARDLWERMSVL